MKFISEFKAFINRGSVVDLAVGVIIGAAFGKIVSSFVADIVMPVVGLLVGGIDFNSLSLQIAGTVEKPVLLHYGKFLQASFDFFIIALAIFFMIKLLSSLHLKHTAEAPPTKEEILLMEIRDILKNKSV